MTSFKRKETLENAFSVIIDDFLKGKLCTAMPGIVTAYDGKNKVTVQPAVNRKYVGQDATPLPPIEDVPVMLPGAGDWWLTFEIEVGSFVLLVCSQRSIDAWKNSSDGATGDASTPRKFSMSDAVAIPGLLHFAGGFTVNPGLELRNKAGDIKISLTDSDIVIDNGSGTITIDSAGKVDINGHLTVDA